LLTAQAILPQLTKCKTPGQGTQHQRLQRHCVYPSTGGHSRTGSRASTGDTAWCVLNRELFQRIHRVGGRVRPHCAPAETGAI